MTKCLTCGNLDLQRYPSHARVGFGRCKLETLPGVFVSIYHQCGRHAEADKGVVEKRMEWAVKFERKGE
jgi:hypothetical protein